MFDDIQGRISCREMLRYHFSANFLLLFVSQSVHTHIYTPCSRVQFVHTQIRGRVAGVTKIAYAVNLQENTAAGDGREALVFQRVKGKLDTHFIINLDIIYTNKILWACCCLCSI